MTVKRISATELQQKLEQGKEKPLLLDVREPFEFEIAKISGSLLIPLNQIQQRSGELKQAQEIVVICHHGIRSQQAAEYLVYLGYSKVLNLVGGIDAWSCQCDPDIPRY